MHILITGGAGFIGCHLAKKLINLGHTVTVIDDLSTGSLTNIADLRQNKNFRFVRDNIRNSQIMHTLISQCDIIYHLAAAVGVQLIVDRPVHTIETNIHGTEVVLEIANKFNRRVLLTSTSEVYGKSEAVPFKEDDDTVLGSTRFSRWSYACSKAIDEFLALAYHQQFGLETIVVRLFNTVGPRQTGQYGMVMPRFVQKALNNENIQIYGDGKQTRCFCFVGDVLEALTGLMDCPEAPGRVYNVGATEEISIEQLAQKIIKLTGSTSQLEYISYEQAYGRDFDDMQRRVPCLDRINNLIGYQPKTNLQQTINTIIDYFKS